MMGVRREYPKRLENKTLQCQKCGGKMVGAYLEGYITDKKRISVVMCVDCGEYFYKDYLKKMKKELFD